MSNSNDNASRHGSGTPSGEGHSAHDPRSASSSDVADYGEASNSASTVRPAVGARNTTNGYVDPGVPSSSMASGSGEAPLVLGDLYADSPPRRFHHNVYQDTTSVFNMEFRDSTPRGRPQRVYGEPHFLHDGFEDENDELKQMYVDAYRSGHITETELRWHFNRIRELQRKHQKKRRFVNFANLAEVQRQLMNRSSRAAGAAALGSTVVETNTGTSDSPIVVSSGVAGGTTASFTSTTSDASTEDVFNTGFVASGAQESPKASAAVPAVADSSTNAPTINQPAESRDCSIDLMCGNEVVTGEDAENYCVQLRFRPRNQHIQPAETAQQSDVDEELHDLSLSFAQIGLTQEEDVVKRMEVDKEPSQHIEAMPIQPALVPSNESLSTEVAMQQLADLLATADESAPVSMERIQDDPMNNEIEDLPDYEDVIRQAELEAELNEMSASLANTSFFVEKDSDNTISESNQSVETAAEKDEEAEVDAMSAILANESSAAEDDTHVEPNSSNNTISKVDEPEKAPEAMDIDENIEESANDHDVEDMQIDENVEQEQTSRPHHDVESSVSVNGTSYSSTIESSNLNEVVPSSQLVLHLSEQPSTSTQAVVQKHANSDGNQVEITNVDVSVQSTQPSEQSQQSTDNNVQEVSAPMTSNSTMLFSESNAESEMNQTEEEQHNQLPSKTNPPNMPKTSRLIDAEPVQVHVPAIPANATLTTTSSVLEEQNQELMQRLSSIEGQLVLLQNQSNHIEAKLSAMNSSGQNSSENPMIAANQREESELPEQNDVVAEHVQVHVPATSDKASSTTTSYVQMEQFEQLMQEVSSMKKEMDLLRNQSCKCNRIEAPSSSKDSSDQHSLENPVIDANQCEGQDQQQEQPEQHNVAENQPVLPEIQRRAQMCVATGYINRRRSKIRVMPGIRSRLALLLPKFKQTMLQRAQQSPNVQVTENIIDSNAVDEQPENVAASSAPEQTNDQEVGNVEVADTSEPRIEQNNGANLDGAETQQAAREERPKLQLRTAKRLQEIMARQDTEPPMPRPQSPAPFYDSDESCARRRREQEEIDAEMKSINTASQQSNDGNTKEVTANDSDVTIDVQQKSSDDEAPSGSDVSTMAKKRVKRRVRFVPSPCHHPSQAKIIAQLKKLYMWCDGCNLPFAERLIMSDDEPTTCPSCAEDSDEEHPEANDHNIDTANNDELDTGNASDQNAAHQEDSGINGAGDTEAMDDVSDAEVERQESDHEGDNLNQSVNLDDQLIEVADIPPPPTPASISSVENVEFEHMSPPHEDDDNEHDIFGDESTERRPSNNSTDDLAADSGSTQKRRNNNSSDDDEVPTKRPRHQLVVESSSEDEGSSNGGPSNHEDRRPRPLNRRIRRQLGRAMKRKKAPVKPQFGRLHHISELEGVNLPRASPVVNMEGLFLDDDTDLSAEKQVLVVSGDHFQAVLYECGIVVFIGYFDGASHGSALLREAERQPVVLWHFSEDRIKSLAAGPNHLVMLGVSGRVYTVGCAKQGQLGVPKPKSYRQSSIRPHRLLRRVVVGGEEVVFARIMTIGNVTVAITKQGAVYMCGEGYGRVLRKTN